MELPVGIFFSYFAIRPRAKNAHGAFFYYLHTMKKGSIMNSNERDRGGQ